MVCLSVLATDTLACSLARLLRLALKRRREHYSRVSPAICLRARYAMSGTDLAYGAGRAATAQGAV
eukprot:1734056-Rhodomonas_salina.1